MEPCKAAETYSSAAISCVSQQGAVFRARVASDSSSAVRLMIQWSLRHTSWDPSKLQRPLLQQQVLAAPQLGAVFPAHVASDSSSAATLMIQ